MVPKLIILLTLTAGLLRAQVPDAALDSTVFAAAFRVLETAAGQDSFQLYLDRGRERLLAERAYSLYLDRGLALAQACYANRDYRNSGLDLVLQLNEDLRAAEIELTEDRTIELYYEIARGYYYRREIDTANEWIERTLPRVDSTSVYYEKLYNLLGINHLRQAQYFPAIDCLTKVLDARRERYGPADNRVASAMNNLGNAYYWLDLLPRAESLYEEGLRIRRAALGPTNYRLYSLLNNLGNVYYEKGDFFGSILTYQEAIDLLEAQEESLDTELATVYINLASSLSKNGSLSDSEAYYQRAIGSLHATEIPDKALQLGSISMNRANHASIRGDYTEATQLQRRGLDYFAIAIDSLDPRFLSGRNNLGVFQIEQGNFDAALAILLALETDLRRVPEQEQILANLCNDIGDAYLGLGRLEQSERYHERALAIQQKLFGTSDYRVAYTYNKMAEVARRRGQTERAHALVDAALQANNASDLPVTGFHYYEYYLESLLLKGALLPPAEALAIYTIADSVLAGIRNELLQVADKVNFAGYGYQVAARAIEGANTLIRAGDPEALARAFFFSERAKANVLGQLLALNQGKKFAGIPADSLQREVTLLSDISFYKLQLNQETDSVKLAFFRRELLTEQREYQRLMADFSRHYPRYYELKQQPAVPSLAQVRAALPADVAMVSYFTTEETLYCLLLTRERQQLFPIPIDARFSNRLRGLRKTIINRLDEDYRQIARELYATLFPFTLPADIERLILVPDAALQRIPFATLLRDDVGLATDFSQLPYLIRRYRISYSPSVSIWYRQAQRTRSDYPNDLLAYAPVFSDPPRVDAYETTLRTPLSGNVEILRSVTEDGITVAALPGALAEIEQIAAVFDRKNRQARAYLYRRASEAEFKNSLREGHHFVHIATHGFVNETEPDLSGLLFYPDTSTTEDHVLYSSEIYGLRLDTDLLVLSACETGLGEQVVGEGLLGLSRAFMYAGARNLLVSLWKVQDRATAELMVDFYEAYWRNPAADSYADPMRTAKLNMIDSGIFSHPFYWSPFVLIGR